MPDEICASHILRSTESRSKEIALEEINDIKAELNSGADFAELARGHSECPSGNRGGDLGSFKRGNMVPEFEKAAFGLDVNSISDVVKTDFGYHLIHRTE